MRQMCSKLFLVILSLAVIHLHHAHSKENPSDYEEYSGFTSNNVKILKAPRALRHLRSVVVEYYCSGNAVVVVDIVGMYAKANGFTTMFRKAWKCKGQHGEGTSRLKKVLLRLPPEIANRPGFFNKNPAALKGSAKVRVWMVDPNVWKQGQKGDERRDIYYSAMKRDYEVSHFPPKLRRPFLCPAQRQQCPIWYWDVIQKLPRFADNQRCPLEKIRFNFLNYPAVYNGHYQGLSRQMRPYNDQNLEMYRRSREKVLKPSLTFELWVYFLEFCPQQLFNPQTHSCGLFIHHDKLGLPLSPTLLITKEGHLQVEMKVGEGQFDSRRTGGKCVKNKWTRIHFTLNSRKWRIDVNWGEDMDDGWNAEFTYDRDMVVDDCWGLWTVGGVEPHFGGFTGYMGRVIMDRANVLRAGEFPAPPATHPMFELHLTSRADTCTNFLKWMTRAVGVYHRHHAWALAHDTDSCPYSAWLLFDAQLPHHQTPADQCPRKHPYGLKHHRYIKRRLSRMVLTRSLTGDALKIDMEGYSSANTSKAREDLLDLSKGLLKDVEALVSRRGLSRSRLVLKLLKQAACLGNDDAMFDLASLLNNGVGTKVDELQSLAFFMLGSLNAHQPSIMALGHRHVNGLDGTPIDPDAAYMYYKQVADKARLDRIEHSAKDIQTETIRLIDEKALEMQTSETGELFQWMKLQAESGITEAQSALGKMMFHGTQGLNRNLERALEMFREGAEGGDTESMFNAGIIEYRGVGGLKANETAGKAMIEKAAELGGHDAIGALAWMAMEKEKNYTKAYELFMKAKKLGNGNAGYYIGHMYFYGFIPGLKEPDAEKALQNFMHAAQRGNMDAGVMFAHVLSRGTKVRDRDAHNAVIWARFLAETHSQSLARPLRNALTAFRDGNYGLSLYLYLLLASSGLEVASFNVAYLCEYNQDGVTSYIGKECQWRHYNLTVQREYNMVDAYSYIKMGDHYWYGCRGRRNLDKAANFYSLAAQKGDPHALFNLAYMVEEGTKVPHDVWRQLNMSTQAKAGDTALLLDLYGRCRESARSEAYIPCTLAWLRVWFEDFWRTYSTSMKITSALGLIVVIASIIMLLINCLQQRRLRREEAERLRRSKKEDDDQNPENINNLLEPVNI